MIDYALEKYPVRRPLKNQIQCLIRPLQQEDESAFERFHAEVPERERFLIKHRYTDSSLFREWEKQSDFEKTLPLVAFADGQLVGHATLNQRTGGWKRHIGMVGVLTHPEFRGIGLVGLLIDELIEVARHCGLTRLEAEFNGERDTAIRTFKENGFDELVRLPEYLRDMDAKYHDFVLLGMNLATDIELTGAGD